MKKSPSRRLIEWYRKNRILYPWRRTNEAYHIWLSEILLQQTRIPVVLKYYERILKRFPTLNDLSSASESEFLSLWSGVGYYSRAKNMLKCARLIILKHDGRFPSDYHSLLQLPGIGRYTAGALRNVCFEELTPAIDGNIGRVLARLGALRLPIHSNEYNSKASALYLELGEKARPSEFFQALMELGERVCLPQPQCSSCPMKSCCLAHQQGIADQLPVRRSKRTNERYHWYMLLLQKDGAFYYVRNSTRGFLKDAWIFPDLFSVRQLTRKQMELEYGKEWKIALKGTKRIKLLSHTVTFRKISVEVYVPGSFEIHSGCGKWMTQTELAEQPTSSITAKVLTALSAQTSNRRRSDEVS